MLIKALAIALAIELFIGLSPLGANLSYAAELMASAGDSGNVQATTLEEGIKELASDETAQAKGAYMVTVAVNDASKVYGDPDPAFTAEVVGALGEDTVEYTITRTAGEDVGMYELSAEGPADQGNYKVSFQNGMLSVSAATMALEVAGFEGAFDGQEHTPTVVATGVAGEDLLAAEGTVVEYSTDGGITWTRDVPGITEAGSIDFTVRVANPNYKTREALGTLRVIPVHTVSFDTAGGTPVPANQQVIGGEVATRPANPQREGYAFEGWFAGDGVQAAYDFDAPVAGDLVLTARWSESAVPISIPMPGIDVEPDPELELDPEPTPAPSVEPTSTPTSTSGVTPAPAPAPGVEPTQGPTPTPSVTPAPAPTTAETQSEGDAAPAGNAGNGNGNSGNTTVVNNTYNTYPVPATAESTGSGVSTSETDAVTAPTQQLAAAEQIADDATPLAENAPDDETPLGVLEPERSWALVDLLATAASVMLAAVMAFRAIGRRRAQEEECDQAEHVAAAAEERDAGEREAHGKRAVLLAGVIPAAISIVGLLLTQDFTHPMAWVDGWTSPFCVGALANVVLAVVGWRKKRGDEDANRPAASAIAAA